MKSRDAQFRFLRIQTDLLPKFSIRSGANRSRVRRRGSATVACAVCIVSLSLLLEGCTRPSVHQPVTLTLLEEWTQMTFGQGRQHELQQFTRETGIQVRLLPAPESAREKLALWQELLEQAPGIPTCTELM